MIQIKNLLAQHKEQKKLVPFTVKDCNKGSAKAYNDQVEAASVSIRQAARNRAVAAMSDVWDYSNAVRTGVKSIPQPIIVVQPKTSIFVRIYNWFLNIKY